ncbi:MAG: metallophosphoesterase [Methylocystis sp.]|nr:metallophosphoesterase [Methylocystis sp.]
MKLALISDIHANLEALQATLDEISARGVDRIVCLGDIVGYNANPAECIALLQQFDALCIAGNHDRAVCGQIGAETFSNAAARAVAWTRARLGADALDFLGALPLTANIQNRLLMVHGALHPDTGCETVRLDTDERRLLSFAALAAHPSGARICAFGHTHQPAVYEFRPSLLLSSRACAALAQAWLARPWALRVGEANRGLGVDLTTVGSPARRCIRPRHALAQRDKLAP